MSHGLTLQSDTGDSACAAHQGSKLCRWLLLTPTMTTDSVYNSANPSQPVLSEEYVQEAFHSFLKSSLTQAKVEGLLPANVLASAEGDLMITGQSDSSSL